LNVLEAINKRQSIRSFKSDPVPSDILKKIVEGALRAPSASNSQPWEFAVVSGARLEEIKSAYIENSGKALPNLDIPIPMSYPEPWISRRSAVMAGVLAKMGVAREDKQKRAEFTMHGFRLWGAPSCIYVMIERSFYQAESTPNAFNVFDAGLISQNIMLLATEHGLGTIPAIMPVLYPDILRRVLGLPASKLFVLGIPVGYPDWSHGANQFRTERLPIDVVAKFYE
jgi:nitroreductase